MSASPRDSKVCIYYLKGSCAFGQKCNKIHGSPLKDDPRIAKENTKPAATLGKIAPSEVCVFNLQGKCAFGSGCVRSHSTGLSMNGYNSSDASLLNSSSAPICTHYLIGKCIYGDSCHKLHTTTEELRKRAKIKETRAEIDDLLFGRLDVNDKNDGDSFSSFRPKQQNGSNEKPEKLGESQRQAKEMEAPFIQVPMKKAFIEKPLKNPVQKVPPRIVPQITEPVVSKAAGQVPSAKPIKSGPKTKDVKPALKCTNQQNVIKSSPSSNVTHKPEPLAEKKVPDKEVPDKKEDEQEEETLEEELDEEILEERKLTKKERKRQDRFLMTLAKKKLKQKSCEINPDVKVQMTLAFDLLKDKKIDEAIEAFNKIIDESTWQVYHKEALLGLCRCFRVKDNYPKALEFVTNAISRDSSQMYFVVIKHRDAFAIEIASIQLAFGQISSARKSLSCVSEMDTDLFELTDTLSRNISETEKMLNQIVLVHEEVRGGWNFSPQGFLAHVDKHAKLLDYNAGQIVAKVRECMAIATKFPALRLLELECYILQNLKKESDVLIAEIRKEDLQKNDMKKLDVLLILYEYVFHFEWSLFPKLHQMQFSPILCIGNRFMKATHELDGPLCQRWRHYTFQVFPCLVKVEEELLKESHCPADKEQALLSVVYIDATNKGLKSRMLAMLARLEIGPPSMPKPDFCKDLLLSLVNNSLTLKPSHMAYLDRGRCLKVLGQLKDAEEDFRCSIYLKNLLPLPNEEEFFY